MLTKPLITILLRAAVVLACAGYGSHAEGEGDTESSREGRVRVSIDAASVIRTMRGGIGASWHAIEQPIPIGHGGSAWGGNPPPDDDAAWQQIYRHAEWLGLDWCRVEIDQRMYEPERGRFDWDNKEMRILHRILDWCQKHDVDVFLTQMWGNVEWNTFPEWRGDPIRRVHSGPLSMSDFAEGLATLVERLVKHKGYTCIRWLCINNEPGHNWSWWQKPPSEPMSITLGLDAVRKALNEKDLNVPLSGPDWTDLPPLEPQKIDFNHLVGAYDIHTYHANFDWREGGYSMRVAEKRLAEWADWAHARGKPFFLSEMGTMVFGWRDSHPGPGSYDAALKDAEMVVRGIPAGVDAFNRWSFVNRGDLDGQWQLIDTWDTDSQKLRGEFTPHPNSYFVFGLLSRFTAKHSTVLKFQVEGGTINNLQRVFAAALRSPNGSLTVSAVNDADREWNVAFDLRGLKDESRLYRYRVTITDRDQNDLVIEPEVSFPLCRGAGKYVDKLPGMSVTVYTTYKLAHCDPGVISEREENVRPH